MNKVMLTGVRPSGNLTIGNYLGAIKNFVDENYKDLSEADKNILIEKMYNGDINEKQA